MKSFSQQLRWSFSILTIFTLIQAALTIWIATESDYHIEKGRISNRILTEFIDLGGNKQRLKVWLAQYLLTNDSSLDVKNTLLFKMNTSLENLESNLIRDLELNKSSNAEVIIIKDQQDRLKKLKINIDKLAYEVNKIDKTKYLDPGQAWRFMIQIFDSLDGNDLRKVINDAIEIQKLRAAEAETTAKNYVKYFNNAVYFLTALIIILTVILSGLIQNSLKEPIQKLVQAAIEYSKGNMSFRITKYPSNEFGILSEKFNEMAYELEKFRINEIKKRTEIENEVELRTRELKDAVEKLKIAEYDRKIFLSNISHELKTPATAILGEASVTLRGQDKTATDYKDSLQNIQMIGRQLSLRIDDLLLLARIDTDYLRINLTDSSTVEVKKNIEEAINIADPTSTSRFMIDEQIENKNILIDKDRFIQLLVILLDNAARYNDKQQTINIKIFTEKNKLKIQIENSTDRIDQIEFERIFDRYYRSHHARLIRPDGLGIGLHLAQSIVKAHYGLIEVKPASVKIFQVSLEFPLKGFV